MTDERRKWLETSIAAMQAELNGQPVERKACGVWGLKAEGQSYFFDIEYRPKPVPKYRPFTLEEAHLLVGRQLQLHHTYKPQLVERIVIKLNGQVDVILSDGDPRTLAGLCNSWVFADTGKPCGVLVEGEES